MIAKILYYWRWLFGWKKAVKWQDMKCAMVTPLAVIKDNGNVKKISKQLAKSKNWNSVCTLVDLQSGRSYIFPGRNATKLDSKTKKNLKTIIAQGITPVIIVRNDWAARSNTGSIPSVGGQVGNDGFYSGAILEKEKQFLSSLEWLFPYVHFQLCIESSSPLSGNFSLQLAQHLRAKGFKNAILVNPWLSMPQHQMLAGHFMNLGVLFARSVNHGVQSPDPIFNSDGNQTLNANGFPQFFAQVKATRKPYIIWCWDFANASRSIPDAYL